MVMTSFNTFLLFSPDKEGKGDGEFEDDGEGEGESGTQASGENDDSVAMVNSKFTKDKRSETELKA